MAPRRWRDDSTQHAGDRRSPVGSVSCHDRRPARTPQHVSWLLYEHRQAPQHPLAQARLLQQAFPTPVHLRWNATFAQLGVGFGISEATAWRYVDEALDVLTSWAPGLQEALAGLGDGERDR